MSRAGRHVGPRGQLAALTQTPTGRRCQACARALRAPLEALTSRACPGHRGSRAVRSRAAGEGAGRAGTGVSLEPGMAGGVGVLGPQPGGRRRGSVWGGGGCPGNPLCPPPWTEAQPRRESPAWGCWQPACGFSLDPEAPSPQGEELLFPCRLHGVLRAALWAGALWRHLLRNWGAGGQRRWVRLGSVAGAAPETHPGPEAASIPETCRNGPECVAEVRCGERPHGRRKAASDQPPPREPTRTPHSRKFQRCGLEWDSDPGSGSCETVLAGGHV